MPKPKKQNPPTASKAPEVHTNEEDVFDDDEPDSQLSSVHEETASLKSAKKRGCEESDGMDFAGEMQKMLDCFGSDITKTLSAKRKRLETYTQSTIKSSNKKVEEIWKLQQNERLKLTQEFSKQLKGVFTQWETDLSKAKEQEEKLQSFFQQQQKLFQQTRVVQSQRLKTIRQLHEQYAKGIEELEKCHVDQQTSVQSELKKEMSLLQKKILMDSQHQEMANMRKSLQTMLF